MTTYCDLAGSGSAKGRSQEVSTGATEFSDYFIDKILYIKNRRGGFTQSSSNINSVKDISK